MQRTIQVIKYFIFLPNKNYFTFNESNSYTKKHEVKKKILLLVAMIFTIK